MNTDKSLLTSTAAVAALLVASSTIAPESTAQRVTINDNTVSGRTFRSRVELQGDQRIRAVLQRAEPVREGPPPAAGDINFGVAIGPATGAMNNAYDIVGRRYRVGFRFSL